MDYHLHTKFCKHADGEIHEYVRRAIAVGLDEIGFSDHTPMPEWYDPDFRMELHQLGEYIEMVRNVQKGYPQIKIKLGLEADFFPGTESFVKKIIRKYDFDYIIGSIHYIGQWGFDNKANIEEYKRRDIYEVYTQYFELVKKLARSGLFDILGHPDVIKKFGFYPDQDYSKLIKEALLEVKKANMVIEVNTSGLRKPCGEIYPSRMFLTIAKRMGIPITFGSDAHKPADTGRDFDKAVALVKEVGYDKVVVFNKRKQEFVKI